MIVILNLVQLYLLVHVVLNLLVVGLVLKSIMHTSSTKFSMQSIAQRERQCGSTEDSPQSSRSWARRESLSAKLWQVWLHCTHSR
eukprot:SAG11_NODE_46_length_20454_cov_11.499386_4_plen_85_part_00